MLKKLKLSNVGPIPEFEFEFGDRLNLFTGDNGLGKSFLLDIIWYALTRKWPADVNKNLTSGYMARPLDLLKPAKITFDLETAQSKTIKDYSVSFSRERQSWTGKAGRPYISGLVIYAHADGSFSVWDPARNYWDKKGNIDIQERQPAYVFSPTEIWDGLKSGDGKQICAGLIQDWAKWIINEKGWEIGVLEKMLELLSPPDIKLACGKLTRIDTEDIRDIPTIKMPYGEVPVLWASSGIRRILSFAYFLAWSLSEHIKASNLLGMAPTPHIIFLMDEVESHLHPKWQRIIMRGIMGVLEKIPQVFSGQKYNDAPVLDKTNWGKGKKNRIQIFAATHSALVMSSLEQSFDEAQDKWYDFDLASNGVLNLTHRYFELLGDIDTWLTSNAFDLTSSRSIEAEKAINQANDFLDNPNMMESCKNIDGNKIYQGLLKTLSPKDEFLLRFRYICEKKGIKII